MSVFPAKMCTSRVGVPIYIFPLNRNMINYRSQLQTFILTGKNIYNDYSLVQFASPY